MARHVRNPRICAAVPTEEPESLAPGQPYLKVPPSLNLYKIIGDTSSEIVWEQAADLDADRTFSGDPRFVCANQRLAASAACASIHPDEQTPFQQALAALCSGQQDSFSRRIRALACDGSWIPVEAYARSLRDNNGVPRYIVGGFKDLSGDPDESWDRISPPRHPVVSDIIWERSLSGENFALSDGVERLFGYSRNHFQNSEDLTSLLHPEDRPIVRDRMAAVHTLTGCDCLIVRVRHNDGTWRQVEMRVVVLRDPHGEGRLIGTVKDITPKALRNLPPLHPSRLSVETGLYTLDTGQAIIEKNLLSGLNLQALLLVDFCNLEALEADRGNRWKQLFLQRTANILRNLARENDIPIHYRDRSFLLFADQYESFRELTDLTRNLHRLLGAACTLGNEEKAVAFSIGIAIAPYDALTFPGLLECAVDAATDQAGIHFYDSQAAERFRQDSILLEEERRREKEEMHEALQTIMDNVDSYLFVVHPGRHEVLFSNRQIRSIRPECLPGASCHGSFFHEDKPCATCSLLTGQDFTIEKNGKPLHLQLRHKKIRWLNNEMVYLISGTDITTRKLYAQKLEYMAYHDVLLSIPNRQAVLKNLQQLLREGTPCTLLLLDISDFKLFNETFGHAKGDLLLKEVCRAVTGFVPENSLYRFGGDEFLVILPGEDTGQAERLAKGIRNMFQRVVSIEDLKYTCTLDIGISFSPQHGTTPSTLITHAEMALAQARLEGRGIYSFNEELDKLLSRRKLLQTFIRSALENSAFEVYYQPVFDNATGTFRKAEALLRLRDPSGAFISPVEFIPVAEGSGLIVDVGYFVLDTVCRQILEMPAQKEQPFQIALNISVIQLFQTNFVNRVMEIIQSHGINPEQLEFEITESVLINSFDQVKSVMQQLRNRGIRFALDDFGTGYSSLSYLTHLPISTLKLDRSFIQYLETSENNRQICKGVIGIARHFEMAIVAEGVENLEQARIITGLGATSIQGFYYARPMPGSQLVSWLENNHNALRQQPTG